MKFTALLHKLFFHQITHKFYYGQGAHLTLSLLKRSYLLQIQTIWEDYSLIQINGLTGIQNYIISQNKNQSIISDQQLDNNYNQIIRMKLQIPEDFSYNIKLYGSLQHKNTFVNSKMRGNQANIQIISKQSIYKAVNLQNMRTKILNPFGHTIINQLVSENAQIISKQFQSKKISIAKSFNLKSQKIFIRSLIHPKGSSSILKSKSTYCQSIMGNSRIQSNQVQIKRWYGEENDIYVKSDKYRLGVQTGSGIVEGSGSIVLGKLHSGKIQQYDNKKIIIL